MSVDVDLVERAAAGSDLENTISEYLKLREVEVGDSRSIAKTLNGKKLRRSTEWMISEGVSWLEDGTNQRICLHWTSVTLMVIRLSNGLATSVCTVLENGECLNLDVPRREPQLQIEPSENLALHFKKLDTSNAREARNFRIPGAQGSRLRDQ